MRTCASTQSFFVLSRGFAEDLFVLAVKCGVIFVAAELCGVGGGFTLADACLGVEDPFFFGILSQAHAEILTECMGQP